MVELKQFLVAPDSSIREVMTCIDRNAKGIALVVGEERRLIGTVTDGDIRRAILADVDLSSPIQELLDQKLSPAYPKPITAPLSTSEIELLHLMNQHAVRQIPLLDDGGRVVDLALLSELIKDKELPLTAVVMAGGYGNRLCPLTKELPKPMLPIGDRPLIEHIVEQLRDAGIQKVTITTHYLPEKIKGHFGNGEAFGVEIDYLDEGSPLGTAGALAFMKNHDEPLLVINGDILTRVDFRAMLAYHREHEADITMGVRKVDLQVPYGVLDCEGSRVSHLREKPQHSFLVNAGIYLLEPSVYQYIQTGKHYDMTDLIQRLLKEGRLVVSFPIVEYWLDIGQVVDYEKAQEDMKNGRV